MQQFYKFFIHLFIFSFSFLIARSIYMNYMYRILVSFSRNLPEVDFWIPLFHTLIITFSLYLFLQSFYTKHTPKIAIKVFYFVYFGSLIYVLFLNTFGIRGFDLNPFSFIMDLKTPVVFFNMTMFIPFGWMFDIKIKTILIFIFGILIVESIQYIFYLGIFDIGDVIANTIGFMLGSSMRVLKIYDRLINYIK